MDTRSLEYIRAMQRTIAVVESRPELQQLTAQSRAFELFRDAVDELANWEPRRQANEMEIQHRRIETDQTLNQLLGDFACVQAAAELVPSSVASLPDFKLPSTRDPIVVIVSHVRGVLNVARQYELQLVDAGMHPYKLADVERSAEELSRAYNRLTAAEGCAETFPEYLPVLKEQVRKRHRLLYLELRSAMTHEARADWKMAGSLGRKHRTNRLAGGQNALQAPPVMKMLPSATQDSSLEEPLGTAKNIRYLAGRALRRVIRDKSGWNKE
jgi:hypothetical protein